MQSRQIRSSSQRASEQWDGTNEPGLKIEVENILSELGLTVSETVHLLCRQIKLQRGLPFDVRIPNEITARALKTSQQGKGVKRFGSKKELSSEVSP